MNRLMTAFFLLTISNVLFAQKEANLWYFGEKAGLDFSSGVPVSISNGQLTTTEGCATLSDKNGALLFYTNGENVWNRNHQIMPNGTGLMGGYSSTHSSIVVPFPDNDSLYYIFTTAMEKTPYGLRYSIVNMKNDNGSGDITTKNILLLENVYEKVSAVKKMNCPEYWIVTKKWDSDEYYSYLVTSSGIGAPVVSKTGNVTGGPSGYSRGQTKFSPDGTKLAVAYNVAFDFVELMNFDQATGLLSNPIKIASTAPSYNEFNIGSYGVEFSPNSQLLYLGASYLFSTPKLFTLHQYNISYSDASQILASKKLINDTEFMCSFQLGPDRKIYLATYDKYLNVINHPDVEGTGCGFSRNAVQLSGSSMSSLPTFIQSFFTDPIVATGNCEFQNINFSIQHSEDIKSVEWNFGDPASGVDNASASFTPLHIYSTEGSYKVRLIYLRNGGCFADTVYKNIYAGPFKLYLGKDTTICKNDTLSLAVDIPNAKYLWSSGSVSNSMKITDAGKYWITANLNSCLATDSIYISVQDLPVFSLGKDTSLCFGSSITLTPTPEVSNAIYQWSTGVSSARILVDQPAVYWLTITDDIGCHKTDSITLSQTSLPNYSLGSDTSLCQTMLKLNATVAGAGKYYWNTGENTPSVFVNQSGTYWAEVTKDNCTYRDSIEVFFKPFPVVSLGRDTTLCEDANLFLDAQNMGATYLWQDHSTAQTYLVSKPGNYSVTVSSNGCTTKDTVAVNYRLKPVFNLGTDFPICSGEPVILKPNVQNGNKNHFAWQDGSTEVTYKVTAPGVFTLTVSNECGSQSDSVTAFKGVCKMYVPTAFTPNVDGLNDVFKPSFGENISNFKMEIYNRWGQKIFEANDIRKGWDGTYKGKILPGIFVWIIKYDAIGLNDQIMKGTVMLIK